MDFTKEGRIARLLSKKLAGEITSEEQALLDIWAGESPHNEALQGEMLGADAVAEYDRMAAGIDPVRGVEKIRARLRRSRLRRAVLWGASSAAVVVAGVLGAFFLSDRPESKGGLAVTIEPGSHQAVMTVDGGDAIYLRDTLDDSEWQKYAAADSVQMNIPDVTVEVPRGGEYRVRLDDGTMVCLNSESSITYPKQFAGGRREVRLRGEAYFEVARNEKMPFVVSAGTTQIAVLGTSFNVSAYAADRAVTTTLITGSVEIATPHGKARLVPGDQAVVREGSGQIAVTQVDPNVYASWVTGAFEFETMRLEDICARLSRWYDVEFAFEGGCGEERFTGGTWKYVALNDFLEKIGKVTDVSFRYEGGRIIVSPSVPK